ncbi:MAG: iron chelate uptake ABC transporter family permease subunit [Pirellulaceae bacterium]|nr:iron chelate uptake ABC transporter family permease subunit [Pirellulaceae bacterium]
MIGSSIAWVSVETSDEWFAALLRLLTLADYNTRIVILGTALLGCAAGVVGSFTLLRKRALVGDAISHAMLPGLGIAFLVATLSGGDGRSLPILFTGATISGLVGAAAILGLRSTWRLSEDAAFGIVLSVFFGAGVALLGVIQSLEAGHAAGLEGFIYGKTASLSWMDLMVIITAAAVALVLCTMYFKELALLCFDQAYAETQGYSKWWLDGLLMSLVVGIAITGMQAVGLILVIALLIIPAAAARFWTHRLSRQVLISAGIGMAGCFGGGMTSALLPNLPAGAVIILACATLFLFSLMFGGAQGLVWRAIRRRQWQQIMLRQHLLRAVYERAEAKTTEPKIVRESEVRIEIADLMISRSWSRTQLERLVDGAQREGLITRIGSQVALSKPGWVQAKKLTHQHRLWEMYLITHADVALQQVDRLADDIEHVLEPSVIHELERLLQGRTAEVVKSPHQIPEPS